MKVLSSLLLIAPLLLLSCSHTPVKSEDIDVKVSRKSADTTCREIGVVTGTTSSHKGTEDEAIEDLKADAARKGANYVRMETFSAYGNTAKGTAYFCP